jgi:hypothetical protein
LTVHSALLQSGEHFRESHRGGHNAQALVGGDVHGVFHGAHLQALQVARLIHRTLAVGHVAHAVFTPSQSLEAFGVELAEQFLADGAIQHGACVCFVTEQERHIQDARFGHKVGHRAGRCGGQFLGAQLDRLDGLALTT